MAPMGMMGPGGMGGMGGMPVHPFLQQQQQPPGMKATLYVEGVPSDATEREVETPNPPACQTCLIRSGCVSECQTCLFCLSVLEHTRPSQLCLMAF